LPKGDPALGLSKQMSYHPQRLSLHAGDWLLLYSDGLTECADEQGNFLGRDRMMREIESIAAQAPTSGEAIGRAMIAAVESFRGQARLSDDISIAVLMRR